MIISYHGNSYSIHVFIFIYIHICIVRRLRFFFIIIVIIIYEVDFIVNVTIDKLFLVYLTC